MAAKEKGKELKLNFPALMIFSAKRNSGKSHLITWLMYKTARQFNHIVVICPTSFSGHYQKYLPPESIFATFDENIIDKLFARQAKLLENKDKKEERILIILDDCISSSTFKTPTFQRIAAEGRHYKITVLISTQHYAKMPPVVRLNADYIFILGNQTKNIQTLIFDEFGGDFDTLKDFSNRLKECTADYGAFVIDNLHGENHGIRAPAVIPKFTINRGKN